jgi:hypothetical protein
LRFIRFAIASFGLQVRAALECHSSTDSVHFKRLRGYSDRGVYDVRFDVRGAETSGSVHVQALRLTRRVPAAGAPSASGNSAPSGNDATAASAALATSARFRPMPRGSASAAPLPPSGDDQVSADATVPCAADDEFWTITYAAIESKSKTTPFQLCPESVLRVRSRPL